MIGHSINFQRGMMVGTRSLGWYTVVLTVIRKRVDSGYDSAQPDD
jgi:hypothetical protein